MEDTDRHTRQECVLTHEPSGNKFSVFLTEFEITKAQADQTFLEEMTEKYYHLFQNNLVMAVHPVAEEPGIDTDSHPETVNEDVNPMVFELETAQLENTPPGVLAKLWNDTNIRILIDLCKNYDDEFSKSIKKHVWQKIAKQLSEKSGVNVSPQQCDTKFKGLKDHYKSVKKHNDQTGNNPKYWTYFDIMDDLMHKKPEITPKFSCSSARGLLNQDKCPVTVIESLSDGEIPSTSRFQSSFSRKRKDRESISDKRHKEKMQKQDRYLDLLERIAISLERDTDKGESSQMQPDNL